MQLDTHEIHTTVRPRNLAALAQGLLGLVALLALSSCVSQARYNEALENMKFYQRGFHDMESAIGPLEAENELLRGELALAQDGVPIEAVSTREIDARMAELERMAKSLGGAPGEVTVLTVEGGYGLRLEDSVLFETGSTELGSGGKEVLVKMAREINLKPYEKIWVRGHTDAVPIVKPETRARFPYGNLQLSALRALVVADQLIAAGGLDPKRVVVAGFGPNEPVATNASPDGKRKNRRVEIFVIEDEDRASGAGD